MIAYYENHLDIQDLVNYKQNLQFSEIVIKNRSVLGGKKKATLVLEVS